MGGGEGGGYQNSEGVLREVGQTKERNGTAIFFKWKRDDECGCCLLTE